ncbi:hypothetical protein [Hymenobacter norwichensis]|uniref:hypothetical protein n=1 Tax=Hymenobacter norwichensis TaxID=223903 RepID=UPI0003B4230A|nr:hypothetical protein [Hymenobacter norwichensis]
MNHNDHIDQTVRNMYHAFEHPGTHPLDSGLTAIDGWITSLDGIGGSALAGIQSGLRTLRGHIERGDRPAVAASLQQLGQETSVIARDLRGGDGDHLRHLGQALIVASGNLKAS